MWNEAHSCRGVERRSVRVLAKRTERIEGTVVTRALGLALSAFVQLGFLSLLLDGQIIADLRRHFGIELHACAGGTNTGRGRLHPVFGLDLLKRFRISFE